MRLKTRRWSRLEYERLVDEGMFGPDQRLELLEGRLVVREPQGSRHAAAVAAVHRVLTAAFGPGYHVRDRGPVALDDSSEPEPDLAVVRGEPWDYLHGHPAAPVLVVEVAESMLALDRTYKAGLYARAAIAEYWIVNLVDLTLEVHREPGPSYDPPRHAYRRVESLRRGATISALGAPGVSIAVDNLLPPP